MAISDDQKNFKKLLDELRETNREIRRATTNNDNLVAVMDIVRNDFDDLVGSVKGLANDVSSAIPGLRSVMGIGKFFGGKVAEKFIQRKEEKQIAESLDMSVDEYRQSRKEESKRKSAEESQAKKLELIAKSLEAIGKDGKNDEKFRKAALKQGIDQKVIDKYLLESTKNQETVQKESNDIIKETNQQDFTETLIKGQDSPVLVEFAEGISKSLLFSSGDSEGTSIGGGAAVEKMKEAQSIEFQKIDLLTGINESLKELIGVTEDVNKKEEKGWLAKLTDGVIGAIGGALAGVGATLASSVSSALKGVGSLASGATKGVGSVVTGAAKGVGSAAKTGIETVGKFAKNIPFGQLSKALPIAGLAVGLAEAIYDGFIGWTKSEEWGVSNIAGAIGGFLAGDGAGGIMNAFKNAGKWAGIGAGVGLIFGPPGVIAGGLIGAALGGILGFIGAETIAKSLDGIGKWFSEQFNSLIIAPIKGIWEAVAPDWLKEIKFEWKDLLPPALISLFSGEYFTVKWDAFSWYDLFPKFLVDFFSGTTKKLEQQTWSWTDLFPKFLVDIFNNVSKELEVTSWSWTDLLPPFLQKFFAGQYAVGKEEFQWKDLVPPFITKAIEIGKNALAGVDFSWRSLLPGFMVKIIDAASDTLSKMDWSWKSILPNFLVKIIDGEAIEDKDKEFEWRDLVPGFITKIVDGFIEANPDFKWQNLLPSWMVSAWDAAKSLVSGETTFEWKNLLPNWMTGAWDAAKKAATEGFDWQNLLPSWMIGAWESSKGLASQIGGFDWRSLLPQFIQDLFPGLDGKQLTIKDGLTFDWRSLLPQFIQDLFPNATGQPLTIAKGLESVGAFAWTSLLPKFIQNLIEGKPIADADKGFDWKDLLPQFIRDFLGDEKVEVVGGLYTGWWKSLLPNFITNWIDGKPIFGETDEDGSLQSGWWKSLLPNWAKNIVDGKSPFATMTEGLEDGWWKKLLPTWVVNIIDGKSPFENVLPSISSIETELKNFSKKIYDPETGTVFGFALPTLPSIADIGTTIKDFGTSISTFFSDLFDFDSVTKFIKDKIPFSDIFFGNDTEEKPEGEEQKMPSATESYEQIKNNVLAALPKIPTVEELKNALPDISGKLLGYFDNLELPTWEDVKSSFPSLSDVTSKVTSGFGSIFDWGDDEKEQEVPKKADPAVSLNAKAENVIPDISDEDLQSLINNANPINIISNFAKKVGTMFDDIFDTSKIKQFVLDYIPFASLLMGDSKEKKEGEEIKPAETNDIITALFGTTNLTDFLVNTFNEIVDTLIYNIDTLLGEIIPGYESRAEKIESLKEELVNESNPMFGSRDEDKIASIGQQLQDLGVSEDEVKTLLIEKKAKGGILPKGSIGLVGEEGPELITPTQQNSQVINSNQTNTILEKLVRTTTARTQMIEQNSKNMSSSAPVFINNVDNSVRSNGGGGGTIPIPKPVNNPNTDLLAAVAAVF